MLWATVTCCSRGHPLSSTRWSCDSSFATRSQPPRLLELDSHSLWFSPVGQPSAAVLARRKVEPADVAQALADLGDEARYNQLRQRIMVLTECSKRTAQLAIAEACQRDSIVLNDGYYRLPR